MIIDSHFHLEFEHMASNLNEVIDRATRNNVRYLLSISTTDESFDKILQIIKNHKNIYGTYGIHPHETKNYQCGEGGAILLNDITYCKIYIF